MRRDYKVEIVLKVLVKDVEDEDLDFDEIVSKDIEEYLSYEG